MKLKHITLVTFKHYGSGQNSLLVDGKDAKAFLQ
jgi:hypothetical protein